MGSFFELFKRTTEAAAPQLVTNSNGLPVELVAGSAAIGTVDTELPAAAAAGDAVANPTTTNIMSMLMAWNGATWSRVPNQAAVGDSITGAPWPIPATAYHYNGGSFDRARSNVDATVLASAARTATTSSADFTNYNGRGVKVVFDITAVPGVETVTLTIQGKDSVSGKYYTILAGTAQAGTGTLVMTVYPGITASANLAVSDILPRTWRVTVTHSASGSFTYSVGASTIL